jgi:hypothetical protein
MDGKVLEDAFFRREVDLWRAQLLVRNEAPGAGAGDGVVDAALIERMAVLGISSETLDALTLISLVEVAWSDGDLDDYERAAVLRGAEAAGVPAGSPSHDLLRTWLDEPPGEALHDTARDYIRALSAGLSVETRIRLRERLVGYARGVAEASGGFLGIRAVSREEEAVLEQLDEAFGI